MSTTRKKDNDFVMQAGILAAAGIICRLIGLVYRVPLANILTDEGNGYYSTAYNIYTIVLLLASYSIPSAISKLMAGKLEQREYRNAQRIFYCALIYVGSVGLIASLFLFFGADLLLDGKAALVLRAFAPTVLIYGFLGVLRGFFQAHKSMVQTSVSQIFEQILNAGVSVGAAYFFMKAFDQAPEYGAIGSALGTMAGVVTALLVMLWAYRINRKMIRKRIEKDRSNVPDSYGEIFKSMLFVVTPIILSTFIYNFNITLNNNLFTNISMSHFGLSEKESYAIFGIYSGKAVLLSDVPVALASAMSAALIPVVSGTFVKEGRKAAGERVEVAVHTTMLFAIPAAVGMFALAEPILQLLFSFSTPEDLQMAVILLRMMTVSIAFYSLSTVSNGILQGIGKVNRPVINAAIALLVQSALVIVLLLWTKLGIYALPIAFIVYALIMSILNQLAVRKELDCRLHVMQVFVKPFISALVMGGAAYLIYTVLYMVLPFNIVAVAVAVIFAIVVYVMAMILCGGITEETLDHIPMGGRFKPILRKIGLKRAK